MKYLQKPPIFYILTILLFANIFIVALLTILNQHWNSDFANALVLLPKEFGTGKIVIPSDTFILTYIFVYILSHFITDTFTLLLTESIVYISILFCGYYYFYLRWIKETKSNLPKIIYFIPLFYLANQSSFFYQIISEPWLRYPLFSIFLLTLFVWQKDSLIKKPVFLSFFTIVFSFLISNDPYYFFVFVLPLVIALFVKNRPIQKLRTGTLLIAYLLLLSGPLSLLIDIIIDLSHHFFIASLVTGFTTINNFPYHFSLFITNILALFNIGNSSLSLFNFILLLFASIGLCMMFKRGYQQRELISIFIPLFFLFTALIYIFSLQAAEDTGRYLFTLPFLVLFGNSTLLQIFYKKNKHLTYIYCGALCIVGTMTFLLFYFTFKQIPFSEKYSSNISLISTLDEFHLKYGYSDYWDSSINIILSNNQTTIRSIICRNRHFEIYAWNTDIQWYASSNFVGNTFLLLHQGGESYPYIADCATNDIINQFGQPTKIVDLSIQKMSYKLFIFPYNIAEKL